MRKLAFLTTLAVIAAPLVASDVVEVIVARVNNEIITLSELTKQREILKGELSQRYNGLQLQAEYQSQEKNLLRDLIDNQLLIQKGKDESVNVDAEVIKQLDAMRKQQGLPSMEALEKAVNDAGIAYEDYKQNMKNQLIQRQVVNREVGSRIQVSNEDVAKFYEDHKKDLDHPERVYIRIILVSTAGKTGDDLEAANKKAQDITARARKGSDFGMLAAKESDDKTTGPEGGDLRQYYKKGELDKGIETPAFAAKKGDILEPIKTSSGWLIVKVEEHQQAGVPALSEVQAQINEQIYMQKMAPAFREYLNKLRNDAYMEIRTGYDDTGTTGKLSGVHLIPVDAPPEDLTTTVANAKRAGAKSPYKPWTWMHKSPIYLPPAAPAPPPATSPSSTPPPTGHE